MRAEAIGFCTFPCKITVSCAHLLLGKVPLLLPGSIGVDDIHAMAAELGDKVNLV